MVSQDNRMVVLCRSDDETELDFFAETVRRADSNCRVENFATTEEFLTSIRKAESDQFRFCLCISDNVSDYSVNELIARIRGMSVLMPVVRLKSTDTGLDGTDTAIPAGSMFSISRSFSVEQLDRKLQSAFRLSNQFFGLQSNTKRFQTLTPCETEIVRLATEGFPNKSIARKLDISIKTVEKYRRIAYTKLHVSSTAELASLVTFQHCWLGTTSFPATFS